MLQVICTRERLSSITRCILTETTSLGVRYYEANRYLLERDHVTLDPPRRIPIKRIRYPRARCAMLPNTSLPPHRSRKRRSSQDRIRRRFKEASLKDIGVSKVERLDKALAGEY